MMALKNALRSLCSDAANRAVPEVRGLPLFGTSFQVMAAGGPSKIHLYVDSKHKLLGPIFRERLGPVNMIMLCEPAEMRRLFTMEGKYPEHYLPPSWALYNKKFDCKRGLFFMEGEEWLHYRRIMNKYLLKEDIVSELSHVFDFIVQNLTDKWLSFDGGKIKNLEHELYRHSVSFVMGTLMGSSYIQEYERFNKDIDKLASIFVTIFETTAKMGIIPANLAAFLRLPVWNQFVEAVDSSLTASADLLLRMADCVSDDGLLKKLYNEGIDPTMVENLVVDLMLAAGDTTAYTTQWALYLLSKDKNGIQERIYKSEEKGSLLTGVMKETLRLYPPAIFISRILPQQSDILGYTFQKGELVMLSLYTAGRSEENFSDADKFLPERWERNTTAAGVKRPAAFIPFAIGARACVGRKLAQAQITSTIYGVLKRFELKLLSEVDIALKLVPVPDRPLQIEISSRKAIY